MSIDFDKLLNDYLERIKLQNPDIENDPFLTFNYINIELAAKVCISILKEYERLKSQASELES